MRFQTFPGVIPLDPRFKGARLTRRERERITRGGGGEGEGRRGGKEGGKGRGRGGDVMGATAPPPQFLNSVHAPVNNCIIDI